MNLLIETGSDKSPFDDTMVKLKTEPLGRVVIHSAWLLLGMSEHAIVLGMSNELFLYPISATSNLN